MAAEQTTQPAVILLVMSIVFCGVLLKIMGKHIDVCKILFLFYYEKQCFLIGKLAQNGKLEVLQWTSNHEFCFILIECQSVTRKSNIIIKFLFKIKHSLPSKCSLVKSQNM